MNVQFVYDNGYSIVYTGYEGYSDPTARIDAEFQELHEVFLNEFGLRINRGSILPITSFADKCPEDGNTPVVPCQCGGDMGCGEKNESEFLDPDDTGYLSDQRHHKNVCNILAAISAPVGTNVFKVVYTGHTTCKKYVNGHVYQGVHGFALPESRKLLICDQENTYVHETITLIHEFGHMYGAEDHYGSEVGGIPTTEEMNNKKPGSVFSPDCIYGEYKDSYTSLDKIKICTGCREKIQMSVE